jgi:hypothetical protein
VVDYSRRSLTIPLRVRQVEGGWAVRLGEAVGGADTDARLVGEPLHQAGRRRRAAGEHLHLVAELEALRVGQHGDHRHRCSAHVTDLVSIEKGSKYNVDNKGSTSVD